VKLKVHIPWKYGDDSAAELPRVYFSSHPNNTFYINEILGAMNKTCESAVWYPENQHEEWTEDELYEQMSEIDLIVVPITRQYLREPNRARDVEVPHALERHIPILFLLLIQPLLAFDKS